jgi:hypothetical protein
VAGILVGKIIRPEKTMEKWQDSAALSGHIYFETANPARCAGLIFSVALRLSIHASGNIIQLDRRFS